MRAKETACSDTRLEYHVIAFLSAMRLPRCVHSLTKRSWAGRRGGGAVDQGGRWSGGGDDGGRGERRAEGFGSRLALGEVFREVSVIAGRALRRCRGGGQGGAEKNERGDEEPLSPNKKARRCGEEAG